MTVSEYLADPVQQDACNFGLAITYFDLLAAAPLNKDRQ
jgi:hypothetical protein